MSLLTVSPSGSETIAVAVASATFAATLDASKAYWFASTTACYITQHATAPAAAAGAQTGSVFVPANTPVHLHGANGIKLAVIRASADGFATLAKLQWH